MKTMLRVIFLSFLCIPYISQAQCPVVNMGPDTIVCSGSTLTLDVENTGATYLWSDGSTLPQLDVFFEGEYFVEVTRSGCTVYDTIYVQQSTVIYAEFNYTTVTTCSPIQVEFSEYSETCNGSITSWLWDFGDGTTSTQQTPVHGYAIAGDYTVSLSVENTGGASYNTTQTITVAGNQTPPVALGNDTAICSGSPLLLSTTTPGADVLWSTGETDEEIYVFSAGQYTVTVTENGCTGYDTINVTVNPRLRSDFSFATLTGCLPVRVQFTDLSTFCGSPITQWYWEFGDGTTSTERNPVHNFASQATFAVRLRVTNAMSVTSSRSKPVVVTAIVVDANLGADTTICVGDTLTLDAANPGATYLWNTGETSRTIDVDFPGEYEVEVRNVGCVSKDTIMVNNITSASVKWGYAIGSACLPVNVTFTDSTEIFCGQSITQWQWNFGDGSFSNEQHPVHAYNTSDSFVVRLTITTSGGSSYSRAKTINVVNTVHTVVLPEMLSVCRGGSVQLEPDVVPFTDNGVYSWSPAFGLNDAQILNPVLTPVQNGWYTLEVTHCSVTAKDSVFVMIDSIAKPTITQSGNTLVATQAEQWQWYRDGVLIAGATAQVQRGEKQGYYSVRVFSDAGCENLSDGYFFTPVVGREKEQGIRVKASPNPAKGYVTIVLSAIPSKPARVSVYDARGRSMFTAYIQSNVNPLYGKPLAKGMYFVEVVIDGKRKVLPVVIQ